jgi:hypothetical protein
MPAAKAELAEESSSLAACGLTAADKRAAFPSVAVVVDVPAAVSAALAEEIWEARLAATTADEHAKEIPGRTPAEIADQLLSRLLEKKKFRAAHNLNHWPNYAPEYLMRLVRWLAHERKKQIEAFIQRNSTAGYTLALAVTDNPSHADWIVSDTNLELWDGRLREECYLLGIKGNARNFMEKLANDEKHFLPLEGGFVQEGADEDEPLAADEAAAEPGSALGLKTDPLGTLIKAEDDAELAAQVAQAIAIARTDRKYWWIRQKMWGKALGIGVDPDRKVSTKRSPRRIR